MLMRVLQLCLGRQRSFVLMLQSVIAILMGIVI